MQQEFRAQIQSLQTKIEGLEANQVASQHTTPAGVSVAPPLTAQITPAPLHNQTMSLEGPSETSPGSLENTIGILKEGLTETLSHAFPSSAKLPTFKVWYNNVMAVIAKK